mmetsp:Transcript_23042/g.30088  ORF Transcript_23042/g.30088 Transcript_23042/m.30088 type:complete len:156 (+) Transcript_23042:86-553(+)|eukprot:CAMPEP_0117753200 /NCGR_PEP_ID=MMETSP0947-20121206/12075_1 /TAXON_ID=44440 /ORGANISM="Chattonella subsalsa, Strain CCMP2191" /LENGTH=155 /DNA_ID=CAMNT_0005572019 /DNA_START=87 /DNA_END=554 /DNA_ORIENTATION=+
MNCKLFTLLFALMIGFTASFVIPVRSTHGSMKSLRMSEAAPEVAPPSASKGEKYYPEGEIPGKIILSPEESEEQERELKKIAMILKEESIERKYEEARLFGWTGKAEIINGRMAMIGIMSGLTVEWWTGNSIPQQLVNMGQVLGIIPLGDTDYYY